VTDCRVRVYVGRIPTVDAFDQMVGKLSAIHSGCGGWRKCALCRADKNRRYYERHREVWHWYGQIRKLRRLRELLCASPTAP
jgi:hypothetical protein